MAQVIPVVTAVHSLLVEQVAITHPRLYPFAQGGNIQCVLAEVGRVPYRILAVRVWDVLAGCKVVI